ncbi:MAG: sigma-70 family RNA polymerase sigma factor [Candidatus Aminicenantes bacterium]|nr:sigma-70 family RNA polymerase sigma factor [Candidatus Aminicenantes bacterium]
MNEKDEKTLVSLAQSGDTNAFKELVLKYEPQVARTVVGLLGPGPEAEDVGQDTFIKFYGALSRFRGESSVGTYLTRIAINLSLNVIRKRKRTRMVFFRKKNFTAEDTRDLKNPMNPLEAQDLITKGLQMIEYKFRMVLILRYMNGYTTKETAEILNIPQGTVMSRVSRGMEKIEKILKPLYEGTVKEKGKK